MQFDTLVDACNDAVFYENALLKYDGENGKVFCDICNKCPISRSYSTDSNDICVKCYNKLVRNMNFWKTHLRKGKPELDQVIMTCIEQQCDMTAMDNENKLQLFDSNHNCTQNKKVSLITCKYCEAVYNYNIKVDSIKTQPSKKIIQPDNFVDAWYRPQYNDKIPAISENTRMIVEKNDDMNDEDDEEMVDYKEHANTRRVKFIPDDSY